MTSLDSSSLQLSGSILNFVEPPSRRKDMYARQEIVMSKKAKNLQKYILLGSLLADGPIRRETNICTAAPRPPDAPHWVQLAH